MRAYLLIFIVLVTACKKQDDTYQLNHEEGIPLSKLIRFSDISSLESPADNASYITITTTLNQIVDSLKRNVSFHVKGGVFDNGDTIITLNAASNGVVKVQVKSTQPGIARVRATVLEHYSIDTSLTFTTAYPDDMLIEASKYVLDTSDTVDLTVSLYRAPGMGDPGDPAKVFFKVTPLDTSLNLIVPDFIYTDDKVGKVTIANPYKVKGRFEVRVSTLKSTTDTLSKKVLLMVNG